MVDVVGFVVLTLLLHCKSSHKQYRKEWVSVFTNKTLFAKQSM